MKILIEVRGGCVVSVMAEAKDTEVLIVDHDNEEWDEVNDGPVDQLTNHAFKDGMLATEFANTIGREVA